MSKKILSLTLVLALALAMTTFIGAEYVACKDPTAQHAMTEWTETAADANGGIPMERTCTICGYVQKGYGNANSNGVATTKGNIATTLAAGDPLFISGQQNPATGARV